MKILLVNPETPPTFHNYHNALPFIAKRAAGPPLGLITVAAMLPAAWERKLVDMNIQSLNDADLQWADMVFLTGMDIQRPSFLRVVLRCNCFRKKVVAGGPMLTACHDGFQGIDHFILNEAEASLPAFLRDLEAGCAKQIYTSSDFPELDQTPIPQWNLLNMKAYASMNIQYSRGCPYHCEFCSIGMLNGHRPRTKSTSQFIAELDALHQQGWRGGVFIVDDNFIGKARKLKEELLPALIRWKAMSRARFYFTTEASMELAEDTELLGLMAGAGFECVFVGIESPNSESLSECGKNQNLQQDLVEAVRKIHQVGIRVSAGFIVGFDSDTTSIFQQQIDFIRRSAVVTAMIGLLNAPIGTRLYQRMADECRLLRSHVTGDNMDGTMNFIPRMDYGNLLRGYKEILETVYRPDVYFRRVKDFLKDFHPGRQQRVRPSFSMLKALLRSIWKLGVLDSGKWYYWRLFVYSLFRHPTKFPVSITLAVYGFHFRKVTEKAFSLS